LPDHLRVLSDVFAAAPHAAVVHTAAEVINEHGTVVRPLGDRMKSLYAPSSCGQPR
jgi:hypothetical protein